ncbi:Alpha/Beta hydrolase protein [Powellomyces hirtus]|nr:Alpha/Beta hydrolase protein [Powellomyces hirtus]
MSLANFALQLRQRLNSLLSTASLSSVFSANQNATAGDQLTRLRRRETKKAVMLWAGLESSDAKRSLDAEARRAHIGLIVKQNYKAPRDPIVLCHGLFGFDVLGPQGVPGLQIHYWKGIAEALREIGCKVHVSRVGTVAALKTRAHELRDFLENKMEGQRINLVAHSMGGLDCRYVITHLPSSKFKVNSLTTVATPHRGSSFMDWCRDAFGVGYLHDYINKQMDDVVSKHLAANGYSMAGDIPPAMSEEATRKLIRTHPFIRALCSPLDSPAFANLTLDYCKTFNELTPNDPSVHYSSYAAVVPHLSPLAPLFFSHWIVSSREGPNDGLVSLDSAQWGQFMGTVQCDHWQLIPPRIRQVVRRDAFDSVGFYLNLVDKLADQGY